MVETETRIYLKQNVVEAMLDVIPHSHIFTVVFEKRTTGELRRMTCRRDVRKNLKGGESTIANKRYLQSVYDTVAKGYRCFDKGRVLQIVAEGFELKERNFDPTKETITTA
jgi:hypothetical protein